MIRQCAEYFNQLDASGNGTLGAAEIKTLFTELKEPCTMEQAKEYIREFDADGDGTLNFEEFLEIFIKAKAGHQSHFADSLNKHMNMVKISGPRGERMYSQEEVAGFVEHMNTVMAEDELAKPFLPINPDNDDLFKKMHDGVLLCAMVNMAKADTILPQVVVRGKKLNTYTILENLTLGLKSARSLGIQIVNIGPEDIRDGTPHLCLALTWQLVRMNLLKDIQLTAHPELFRLLEEGETLDQLLKLSPEEILIRWMNYQLNKAGSPKRVKNFGKDIADSEAYTIVLHQIAPECCTLGPMQESDTMDRAERMLQEADKIQCRKFVTPREVCKGNTKLNLAFVANIFNTRPGLEELTEAEKAALDEALFKSQGTRLERQFCIWMNSYGVEPFVMNIYDGIKDGLVLLQMIDNIQPGTVDWSKVNKGKMNKFKAVGNLDYAVKLCHDKFGLSIVNISGSDLYDGNEKLVSGLLWQLMRYDYLKVFTKLGGGAKIKDEQIVAWANDKTGPRGVTITGFKDETLRTSKPLFTLIDVIKPEQVDWALFDESGDEELQARNAKYVLSMVRKFGGNVYALPEDILEGNHQMIMTIYASLMAIGEGVQ